MERAAGYIVGAAALERHEIADNLLYAGGVNDLLDRLLGYHEAISQRNLMRTRRISISSQSPPRALIASSMESEDASFLK